MPRKPKRTALVRARVRRGNAEDAQLLRGELLAAAEALFTEGGLEAVSVRAVATRVGVSTMTPYRYFADKNELLSGLLRSVYDATSAHIAQAVDAVTGAREKLRASMSAFFSYWDAHPDHYRLVFLTEQNTRHAGETAHASGPIYEALIAEQTSLCKNFAEEIGATPTHVRLACDVRRAMALGYLYAMQVNRRYPWSEPQVLRATYVEQTILAMERCLRDGPPDADN